LKGLLELAHAVDSSKLACAAGNCDLQVVKFLCEVMHFEVGKEAAHGAIQADKVSHLEYFEECGYKHGYDSVDVAISGGQMQCLEYLSKIFPLKFYPFTWMCAAKSGQIASLQFLMKVGSVPDQYEYGNALQAAASNAHVACIEYLWETFPHMNDATALLHGALQGGHIEVLRLAVAKGAQLANAFKWFGTANTAGHCA